VACAGLAACCGFAAFLTGALWLGLVAAAAALLAGWMAWHNLPPARPQTDLSGRLMTVQEGERKRLSRDLHDGVGQIITALKMELSQVRGAGDGSDDDRLARARSHADEALSTIRNVSRMLRPTLLDDLGLEAALQWHVQDFGKRTGIACHLTYQLPGEDLLAEAVNTCIYRTVQEALNNCEKHSGATEVRVSVTENEQGWKVIVADNGRGFAESAPAGDRFGILGMRERAHMLGGSLQVESNIGQGTTVTLYLTQ